MVMDNEIIKGYCNKKLCPPAQEIINRQKAEIERLNLENLQMVASIKRLKAEAIKEFAERLKSEMYTVGFDIDNLVKEMEEGAE